MDALLNMPRAQAIEGALAFQGLRCMPSLLSRNAAHPRERRSERLKAFLRPHADAGKTITKELVDELYVLSQWNLGCLLRLLRRSFQTEKDRR